MIRKQIGILASSVLAASSANASITLGSELLAVFNTTGNGSYYQLVGAGHTGDSLVSGEGFSIDVTAAAVALGYIESFALFGLNSAECSTNPGQEPCYNYEEFLYVEENGGIVYAGDTPEPSSNHQAQLVIYQLQQFLQDANFGHNIEGSYGDFDANANTDDFLNFSPTKVIFNEQTLNNSTDSWFVPILTPPGPLIDAVYIDANTFYATGGGDPWPLPIPATAWLFFSSLTALAFSRKKQ